MAKAKDIQGLQCDAAAMPEIVKVLRLRLEEMCALRAAALDFSDPEGVHDMRVASRRLRSLLRDFKPYLGNSVSQKRSKQVADALGAVRDEDVAIAALEKFAASETEEIAAGIARFADERRARRTHAQLKLAQMIDEESLAKLQEKFLAQLDRAMNRSPDKSARVGEKISATESFREAARDVVLARFAELQQTSSSLYNPFATKPLHRMRIAAKRVRYAIELSQQCYEGISLKPFAEEAAQLQTSLGELHDCDVWIADLGARLVRLHAQNDAAALGNSFANAYSNDRQAAIWLLRHFTKERTKHYRDALTRWHEWETRNFRARLVAAFEQSRKTLDSQSNTRPPAATINAAE
jgi:CHAD domain-containing protein